VRIRPRHVLVVARHWHQGAGVISSLSRGPWGGMGWDGMGRHGKKVPCLHRRVSEKVRINHVRTHII